MYTNSFYSQEQEESKTKKRNLSGKYPFETIQIIVTNVAGRCILCTNTSPGISLSPHHNLILALPASCLTDVTRKLGQV